MENTNESKKYVEKQQQKAKQKRAYTIILYTFIYLKSTKQQR